MLFNEKLSAVKELLKTTNVALARAAGIDASCVCRCVNGSYVPSKNSRILSCITNGIVKLADKKRTAALYGLCGGEAGRTLREALFAWFSAEDSGLKKERAVRKRSAPPLDKKTKRAESALLAAKLNFLMEQLEVSNAALARYVNVDASAISRYRAGKRSLSSHAEILPEFCRYFAFLSRSQRLPEPLAAELRFLQEDEESAAAKFLEWFRKDDASHLALTRGFLDGIAEAAEIPQAERRTPRGRAVEGKGLSVAEEMFLGGGSVERAFARFAESALDSEKGRTIYFYAADSGGLGGGFAGLWSSLASELIAAGNRIKVIHQLDFNVDGMFRAVEPWLPLYLSGQVEPFYLTKPHRSLMNEFVGVAEELSTIYFSNADNDSPKAAAFFTQNGDKAAVVKGRIAQLLASAKPLLEIYTRDNLEKLYGDLDRHLHADGDIVKVMPLLSLETMPEHLAEKIFDAHGITGNERALFDRYYRERRATFLSSLREVNVTEIYPRFSENEAAAGKITMRRPWLSEGEHSLYSPAEYREHMEAMAALEREHANYRRVFLRDFPFKNMDIISKQGQAVYVIKNGAPMTAFSFLHSHMNYVLERYIERFTR